jgi:UPF0271 protein
MKDINCDLGEGEAPARTRALMAVITSANIACGGHAGDERSLRRCLALCRKFGVRAGAHPGFVDRENFGRNALDLSERTLALLLLHQVGALARVAAAQGVRPHHVKLHGALYHVVEAHAGLARCYARTMARYFPGWKIYASAVGKVADAAREAGVTVWREVFADRAYLASGALVPRREPGALLATRAAVRERVGELRRSKSLIATDGTRLAVQAETICVHGDSPDAVSIAKVIALTVRARAAR